METINYNIFTNDIKGVILLHLDFGDLIKFGLINKYHYNLLSSNNFWLNKTIFDINRYRNIDDKVITKVFTNYLNNTNWNRKLIKEENIEAKYQNRRRLVLHCYLRTLARFNILIKNNLCYTRADAVRRYSRDFNVNFNLLYKNSTTNTNDIFIIAKKHGFCPLLTYAVENSIVFSYLFLTYANKDLSKIDSDNIKLLLTANAKPTIAHLSRKEAMTQVFKDKEVQDLITTKFVSYNYNTLVNLTQFLISNDDKLTVDLSQVGGNTIIKLLIDYDKMDTAKQIVDKNRSLNDFYKLYSYISGKLDSFDNNCYNLDIHSILKLIELDDVDKVKGCCEELDHLLSLLNYCSINSNIFNYILTKVDRFDLTFMNHIDMAIIIINQFSKKYWLPEIKFASNVFDDIMIEKRQEQVDSGLEFEDYHNLYSVSSESDSN